MDTLYIGVNPYSIQVFANLIVLRGEGGVIFVCWSVENGIAKNHLDLNPNTIRVKESNKRVDKKLFFIKR